MALQITTNINVDFYDNKYIMINAKQLDNGSRWVAITCYNQGDLYNLSTNKHTAFIRWKKADENAVLNSCRINNRGEVLVELTEQMLAVDGICYVDLLIVNKGKAIVNIDTGKIITIDDSPILSTQAFCVDVKEIYVDHSVIESSYEYDALNDLLEKANADYTEVIMLSKSYAVGDAGDIRENEDFDNAKYYCEQSSISEKNAYDSSMLSKSYAVGGTGTREGEDTDNSHYYYDVVKTIVDGLNSGFIPMGSISFAELATAEKATGFVYNINEDFITDDTFLEGAGKHYTAGTNVYYTSSDLWDCFGGSVPPTATVDEVKSYLGI